MDAYTLYMVGTMKIKAGKFKEATKWWKENGLLDIASRPYVKSVRCYAVQFGLSGGSEYEIEVWQEIENYAALDQMDNYIIEDPERAEEQRVKWRKANELFEWGPNRLMGDWPESSLIF